MATITLKNVPTDLHRRLKARALRHQRSLNSELLECLQAAVSAHAVDPNSVLARARALRQHMTGKLRPRDLADFKARGRA